MIDAHVHLWRIGANDCVWPTADLAGIHSDHELADYAKLAGPLGITGAILVQSQESERDSRWLLEQASGAALVAGVVGWADLRAHDIGARIEALASAGALVGLRPMVQDLAPGWFDDPALDAGLACLAAADLSLDALIRPHHLAALDRLASRHPTLRIVIDHAAKPAIGDDGYAAWHEAIAPLARHANVACKLSGLLTETAPGQPPRAVLPYLDAIVALFSGDRVIWGSDWPVLNLRGDYGGWLATARAAIPPVDRDAVFGGNVRRFYPRMPA
ncbi:MAG: hydrolase [Sphingomonas bacterium]|uniref:amidohydrolase family protein n=1 Tax=Sphingomonas bacterium TaxID=1895847 RepID=UPI002634E9B4|nr:amidohydrolase family protein [Sphingomonas bacterium]MDB5704021.1 hydrolase [Sphingomonas bacterium]